jgi:glutamate N-acetyltransferase/amino-acid N-acetyltransferase
MSYKVSPLAPAEFPDLPDVQGVRFATINAGIRYKGRDDTLLAVCDKGTVIGGALTKSLTASAPIHQCRKNLKGGACRAILVNAGNSNAFTGKAGEAFVKASVKAVGKAVGCKAGEVYVASTGVIGQPMPADLLARQVPALAEKLGEANWLDAVKAIGTTDTFPKGASAKVKIGGKTITIAGIAKGSGMIAPDMATMLAFVFTDAAIRVPVLQKLVKECTEETFNCITVDGDTSTSDALLVAATGKAGNKPVVSATSKDAKTFRDGLYKVLADLARQIILDGEGASKFITINLSGAASDKAAKKIALTIANSPLVKTAIAGADANWGRIVAAIGRAGEKADRDRIKIRIGGTLICAKGMQVPGYDETPVTKHMQGTHIDIDVELGMGKGRSTVWTCDFTHGYIDINGSYRS